MPTNENWFDRLYQNTRAKATDALSAKVGRKVTNVIAVPADLAYLLVKLAMDPDVPSGRKLDFLLSVAYLLLPLDFIPDKWPILGKIDDIYVGLSAVAKVLRGTEREILMRYWQGDEAMLDKTRNWLMMVDLKFGSGLAKNLVKYVEKAAA